MSEEEIKLREAAERLADAVENELFFKHKNRARLEYMWREYCRVADGHKEETDVEAKAELGAVPENMTMYRCSPEGYVVRLIEPDHWVGDPMGKNYHDEDVRGWAVGVWTTPSEEYEPYYPLSARSHSDDFVEMVSLRRRVKELEEQLGIHPHEHH